MENISQILKDISERNILFYGPIMECCSFHKKYCRCDKKEPEVNSPKTSDSESK